MLYISVNRDELLTERALYKHLLLLLLNVQPLPGVLLIVLVWSMEYSKIFVCVLVSRVCFMCHQPQCVDVASVLMLLVCCSKCMQSA